MNQDAEIILCFEERLMLQRELEQAELLLDSCYSIIGTCENLNRINNLVIDSYKRSIKEYDNKNYILTQKLVVEKDYADKLEDKLDEAYKKSYKSKIRNTILFTIGGTVIAALLTTVIVKSVL